MQMTDDGRINALFVGRECAGELSDPEPTLEELAAMEEEAERDLELARQCGDLEEQDYHWGQAAEAECMADFWDYEPSVYDGTYSEM
jgi:hypothetical protein